MSKAELPRGALYSSPMPAAENRAGFFRHLVRTADPVLLLHREKNERRWELRAGGGAVPRMDELARMSSA